MKHVLLAALVISLAAGADPLLPDGGVDCDTPTRFEVYEVDHGTIVDKQGHLIGLNDALCEPKVTAVCNARRIVSCEAENTALKSGPPPEWISAIAGGVAVAVVIAFLAGYTTATAKR